MDQIKFLSARFLVEYPVSLRSQKSRDDLMILTTVRSQKESLPKHDFYSK